MRYFRFIGFGLVLFLSFFTFISSQDTSQEQTEVKQSPVSLVRKDLLALNIKKLDPPKRNIFTPNSVGWQEIDEFQSMNERPQSGRQNIEALEAEQSFARSLGIRYIGFVKSGQKMTALILFEGEALAVNVGEEIAPGVSISKITLEDITVTGPDQEPRKFLLEGETP